MSKENSSWQLDFKTIKNLRIKNKNNAKESKTIQLTRIEKYMINLN